MLARSFLLANKSQAVKCLAFILLQLHYPKK
nr:MAG TPA: hypothetical protein [Bacteriophage sp.]